jgi:HK97 family phage major capsid protein
MTKMGIKELKKERNELTEKMSAIASTERAAGTSMTDDEKQEFDTASNRVKEIDGELGRLEELRSLSVETAVQAEDNSDHMQEFRNYLQGKEYRSQTVGSNTGGGYTVGNDVAGRVIDTIKTNSGMIEAASSINTSTGTDLNYPTIDDTDNEAVIKAETDARRNGPDVVFGSVGLKSFTYDSGIIKISNELVQDSAVNIENIVINALAQRITRKLQKDFTVGVGTTEPAGLITQTTEGVEAAATTAVTSDELLALQFSVDEAHQSNGAYMMNSNTFLAISQMKDNDGQYILSNPVSGVTKLLFGKRVVVNNNMPDMATGEKAIVFGDLSKYMVRTVQGLNIFKFSEKYQDTNEIGFKASGRFDGTLLDPSAIKHIVMA